MQDLFTSEDFEETVEVKTESTEELKTVEAESKTETKADSDPVETGAKEAEEKKEGDDSGAESPAKEYNPNFSYKVKDKEHEFPDWLRGVVTSKEKEDQLRDLFTKVDGIDSIKESRDRVETDFNNYQQSVQNEIFPVLDKIKLFDEANSLKNFGKAWELSDVKPEDVVDYMLMDKNLNQLVATKLWEQMQLEENGGQQAVEAQRNAWQEQGRSRELEMQNQAMEARLRQMEETTFNQALDFSLAQNQNAVNSFDSINGQGAFKKFVSDYRTMKTQQGINLSPADVINQSISMLGLSGAQSAQGTSVNNNEQLPKVTSQESKQPAAIPNLGTGANVSMVQKQASTWDDYEKSLGSF